MSYELILEDKYTTDEVEDFFLPLREIEGFTVAIRTGYASKTAQTLSTTLTSSRNIKTHQVNITKIITKGGKGIDPISKLSSTLEKAITEIKRVIAKMPLGYRMWYRISGTYIFIKINFYEDSSELAKVVKYLTSKVKSIATTMRKTNQNSSNFEVIFNDVDCSLLVKPERWSVRQGLEFNSDRIKELIDLMIDGSRKLDGVYVTTQLMDEERTNWSQWVNGQNVNRINTYRPVKISIEMAADVTEEGDDEIEDEIE